MAVMTDYRAAPIALATMHAKELALAPAFHRVLGAHLIVPQGLDTDALGTFTGEIERRGTMLEVAVAKARLGMAATGLPLGLASEGTFGPHPGLPYMAGAQELLVLVDDRTGVVISESLVTGLTTFAQVEMAGDGDPSAFLARIGLPDHAVIVRALSGSGAVVKGLRTPEAVVTAMRAAGGRVRLETDMRAHMNATRMGTLVALGERLAERLATPCPACGAGGFGRVHVTRGLPCSDCGEPTGLVLREVFACPACGHREERPRADGRTHASPGECEACNP